MTSEPFSLPPGVKVLSISELTTYVRQLMEDAFPAVWVTGEVSNFKRHSSGHMYLTLKDSQAQLKAVIWRDKAQQLPFTLADGLEVLARGYVSVYPPHGVYQLYIEEICPRGLGALELAFRQLREKLLQRGWFAEERKKPLPRFPRRIALITSPTGAVLQDMLRIITRRWPAEIWVCPVAVQGDGAAEEIVAMIRTLNQLRCVDVLIVGRGGGSLEDLRAFNEEMVAEAIFHSTIPVISAVGHQIDFTIADFVADRRAATPSEAAELVVPDRHEVHQVLDALRRRLVLRLQERLESARQQLETLTQRRVFCQPLEGVRTREQQLDEWAERAGRAVRRYLDRLRQQVASTAARLESLSPLNVLGRGYSLTRKETGQALVRSADEVQIGERIVTRLGHGELVSRVEEARSGGSRHE